MSNNAQTLILSIYFNFNNVCQDWSVRCDILGSGDIGAGHGVVRSILIHMENLATHRLGADEGQGCEDEPSEGK